MFGSGSLPFDMASAYEMSYFASAFLYISIFYSLWWLRANWGDRYVRMARRELLILKSFYEIVFLAVPVVGFGSYHESSDSGMMQSCGQMLDL